MFSRARCKWIHGSVQSVAHHRLPDHRVPDLQHTAGGKKTQALQVAEHCVKGTQEVTKKSHQTAAEQQHSRWCSALGPSKIHQLRCHGQSRLRQKSSAICMVKCSSYAAAAKDPLRKFTTGAISHISTSHTSYRSSCGLTIWLLTLGNGSQLTPWPHPQILTRFGAPAGNNLKFEFDETRVEIYPRFFLLTFIHPKFAPQVTSSFHPNLDAKDSNLTKHIRLSEKVAMCERHTVPGGVKGCRTRDMEWNTDVNKD